MAALWTEALREARGNGPVVECVGAVAERLPGAFVLVDGKDEVFRAGPSLLEDGDPNPFAWVIVWSSIFDASSVLGSRHFHQKLKLERSFSCKVRGCPQRKS